MKLKKSRVYIRPTRMGGYLLGLVGLMFLLAVGYNNNLLLMMTLLLFGLNLVWLIQTNFQLGRLKLGDIVIPSGHAGSPLRTKIFWKKSPEEPLKWDAELRGPGQKLSVILRDDQVQESSGEILVPRRGRWHWDSLKVSTEKPFGLYHAWTYFPISKNIWVYPALIQVGPLGSVTQMGEGDYLHSGPGPHDFQDLKKYNDQEPRRISWKHYAKSGELLVKEGENQKDHILEYELNLPLDAEKKEQYLSELTSSMVEAFQKQMPFRFHHAGQEWGPGTDKKHLEKCLEALSLC